MLASTEGSQPVGVHEQNAIEDAGGVWFKVEGPIAQGVHALIQRATVIGSKDRIAIKVMDSNKDEKGTVMPREVLAMRLCDHPSVLAVKSVFFDFKKTYICTRLFAGGNVLDRTLETGGIAEEDAVIVIQDVLDALEHIHARGMIHTAVEPANIYLISGDPTSPDFYRSVLGGLHRVKTMLLNTVNEPDDLNYVSPELVDKFDKSTGIGPEADLCCTTPFHEKRNADLSTVIKAGDVHFTSPFWDFMSRLSKDFISQLLVVAKYSRMKVKECRQHAWMQTALEINTRMPSPILRAELTLRKLLIFKDVHDDCLHEVAKKCKLVKYLAGEKICKKGKEALSIFFVHSGQVNGSVKGYVFDSIHPGGFFGEAAYLSSSKRHFCDYIAGEKSCFIGRHQIAAKNEVELLQVERRDLDLLLDRFPILKERLFAAGSVVQLKVVRFEKTKVDSRWDLGQEDENHAEDVGTSDESSVKGTVSHDKSAEKQSIADHQISVQRPQHLKVHGGTKHQVVSKMCCLM